MDSLSYNDLLKIVENYKKALNTNRLITAVDYNLIVPVPYTEMVLLITSHDLSNKTGTFIICNSIEEAKNTQHNLSLQQNPNWHKQNCRLCKEK